MTGPIRPQISLSPNDQTLDAAGFATPGDLQRSDPGSRGAHSPRVHLVEGSDSGLSTETQTLLRLRLRSAALVILAGSAAFYLWGWITPRPLQNDQFLVEQRQILEWCHLSHIVGLGLFAAVLWRRCSFCLRSLRWIELGVFGLTTTFFVNVQHFDVLYTTKIQQHIPSTVAIWFTLIFIYAIYIPNTWRRAAAVLAAILTAAIGGYAFDVLYFADVAEVADRHDPFSSMLLLTFIGYGSGVYGTYLINSLRVQAFEGRQFGQYRLKRLLGAGGMGEVYLAEHQLLKRPCALKLIRPGKADDPRTLARFEREVRTIATLSHWNTVEIFDYGRAENGTFYYVMEYLPGLSIADLVERHGPLPPARVIHLLHQVCDALREAHGIGLVHRDVKPGNIFAAKRGGVYDVAKLLDFGLVKSLDEVEGTHLTLDGTITGSPLYMSPEQATGESDPDARSDIYALGAVAFFMLTGRPPFEGEKPLKVLFAHANEPVTPPSQLREDIPDDLEEIVLRCLAKRPGDRYQDAASVAQALQNCELWGAWTRDNAVHWWRTAGRDVAEPVST